MENIATAHLLIGLLALAVLWGGPCARLRRDDFRNNLRRIRDNLFDFMWKNGHSFDTPAYRTTRKMLNGMIAGSNVFHPATFLAAMMWKPEPGESSPSSIATIAEMQDGPLKQKLQEACKLAVQEMVCFVFLRTFAGLVISVFLFAIYVSIWIRDRLVRHHAEAVSEWLIPPARALIMQAQRASNQKAAKQTMTAH